MELLQRCPQALAPHAEMLLELVLTLAQDGWPQVAPACVGGAGCVTLLRLCLCLLIMLDWLSSELGVA